MYWRPFCYSNIHGRSFAEDVNDMMLTIKSPSGKAQPFQTDFFLCGLKAKIPKTVYTSRFHSLHLVHPVPTFQWSER